MDSIWQTECLELRAKLEVLETQIVDSETVHEAELSRADQRLALVQEELQSVENQLSELQESQAPRVRREAELVEERSRLQENLLTAKTTIDELEDELRILRASQSTSKSSSQVRSQQIAGYRDKIQSLNSELEALQQRNTELSEKIVWFEREVDAMKVELATRDDLCTAQRERAIAANEVVRVCMERHALVYNKLIADVENKIEESVAVERERGDILQERVIELEDLLKQAYLSMNEKDSCLLEMREKYVVLQEEASAAIKALSPQVNELSEALTEAQSRPTREEYASLQEELENVRTELKARVDAPPSPSVVNSGLVAALREELSDAKDSVKGLRAALATAHSAHDVLIAQVHAEKTRADDAVSQVELLETQFKAASEAVLVHEADIERLTYALADAEKQSARATRKAEEQSEMFIALQDSYRKLQTLHSDMEFDNETLKQQIGSLAISVASISESQTSSHTSASQSSDQRNDQDLLRMSLVAEKGKSVNLEHAAVQMKSAVEQLQSELELLQTENELLRSDNDTLRSDLDTDKRLSQILQTENTKLRREVSGLQRAFEDKESALVNTDAVLQDVRERITDQGQSDKQIRELEGALAALHQVVQRMDEELSTMQNTITEKDTELLRASYSLSQKEGEIAKLTRSVHVNQDEAVRVRSQLAVESARFERMQYQMHQGCMQAEDMRMKCREMMHGIQRASQAGKAGLVVLEATVLTDLKSRLETVESTLTKEQIIRRELESKHSDEVLLLYELIEQKEKEILSVIARK